MGGISHHILRTLEGSRGQADNISGAGMTVEPNTKFPATVPCINNKKSMPHAPFACVTNHGCDNCILCPKTPVQPIAELAKGYTSHASSRDDQDILRVRGSMGHSGRAGDRSIRLVARLS